MTPLYAYSLLPVVAISLLLFFTVTLRQRGPRGLSAYCLAIAVWSSNLLMAYSASEALSEFGLRMSAVGAFVVAGYLHAAYDLTDQKRYGLVWFAYSIAVVITISGFAVPGLLYDPTSLAAGPMFWPSMVLAMTASMVPLWHLARAYRRSDGERRGHLKVLFGAGFIGYVGAWSNATMLAHGMMLPYGLFLVLGSLLLLASLVQSMQGSADKRLFERSLLYSALAALLSAGFLFGALVFLSDTAEPFLREYGIGALFLFCMAALAFEPVRQHFQEMIGRRISGQKAHVSDLAEALADQEERAHQAERLAELGTFTSAIAHEVRNPLGVISAYLSILQRQGADEETLQEMRDQISRASEFLDELLNYGRPRPLELRMVRLADTVELAISSATSGLGEELPPDVVWNCTIEPEDLTIEADQAQILQIFVILFENALFALEDSETKTIHIDAEKLDARTIRIGIEDSGPGIDEALAARLFDPFVTGRKREGKSHGTGLGLAIASGIVERHNGTICADRSPKLNGARFLIELPIHQNILGAATAAREDAQQKRVSQEEPA